MDGGRWTGAGGQGSGQWKGNMKWAVDCGQWTLGSGQKTVDSVHRHGHGHGSAYWQEGGEIKQPLIHS